MIETNTECARKWWLISAAVGVVVAFIAGAVLGVPWFGSILLGIIVGAVMGYVTVRSQCSEADVETARPASPPSGPASSGTTATGTAASGTTTPGATAAGASAPGAAPTPPDGPSGAPAGVGLTETPQPPGAQTPQETGDAQAEPPAAGQAKPPESAAPATGADDGTTDAQAAGARAGIRDAFLDAPRGGKADDLKLIKGVGPKLEERLNSLGLYHHDQIAALTEAQIAHIDEELDLRGRITRDDWVGQAAALRQSGN